MLFLRPVLLGLVLPGAVSGAVFFVAWRLWRLERAVAAGPWAPALALGAAYAAGHAGLLGWAPFPPREATQWMVYLGLAAAAPGLASSLWRVPAWARWGLRVLLSVAVPALLLRPLFEHSWENLEGALWLSGLSAGILSLWTALEALAERARGPTLPLALVITAAGGSLVLLISGSALVGQLGGALAAALGASLVAATLRQEQSLVGAVPVVVVLFGGLWITGYFYVEMPAASGLLLAVAPASTWVGRLKAVRRLSARKTTLIGAAAALVPVGTALVIALLASPGDSYCG